MHSVCRGGASPALPVFLTLVFFALSATPVHANDVPLSKAHFKRAMLMAQEGKHRDAIREFELAYEANPRPNILFNIGYEHRILAASGSIDEAKAAIDYLQRYLMVVPNTPDRASVEESIADLKAQVRGAENLASKAVVVAPVPPSTVPAPVPANAATADHPTPRWAWGLLGGGAALTVVGALGLGLIFGLGHDAPAESLGGTRVDFQ